MLDSIIAIEPNTMALILLKPKLLNTIAPNNP